MPKEPKDKAVTGRYRTKQTAKKSTGAPAPHIDLISNIQAPPANGKRTSARVGPIRTVTALPASNPPPATNKEVSGADKDNHHNVCYHFPPRIHELNTVASGV